ncbi:MAG: FtsX-like permease family protein [Gemmatimonadaceae bacterium]
MDLGIKIDNVVTFGISPGKSGYDTVRTRALYARVEEELATIPGVSGVTSSTVALLSGSNWGQGVSVEGFHKDPDTDDGSRTSVVGPSYFHVLGVPLLAGRDFTASDNETAMRVVIVNQTFAKKFGLGTNVLGKRMSIDNDSLNIVIVGLAKDAKYSEVKGQIPPLFVTPYRQAGRQGNNTFYVRGALPAEQLLRAVPAAMKKLDPNLPIEQLKTLPQQARENVSVDRLVSTLSAAFAILATVLAAVGLYGVLAYSVAQRTREIGVRMALGANGSSVRGMVLRQVGLMTLIGGVFGIAGALVLSRAAKSLLFEMQGNDPAVLATAVVALSLVAFAAGIVPALRASRIDPMVALRYE